MSFISHAEKHTHPRKANPVLQLQFTMCGVCLAEKASSFFPIKVGVT